MIVVSNTTPILGLYKIGQLHLLRCLFGQAFVPMAVYHEIAVLGKEKIGATVLDANEYIHVKEIQNVLAVNLLKSQLDYGEAEAIVLARELGADLLLLDEKKARKVAKADLQPVIGTVGILQLAKDKGVISEIKTYLDELIEAGMYIDQKLYAEILSNNGEATEL